MSKPRSSNGDVRGLEPEEIEVIALVTRYSRRATPGREHIGLVDLNEEQRRIVTMV